MPRELYCDAVLLDMDGTLVDSTECVIRHWRIWTERHQLDLDKLLEFSHGRPTLETMMLVAPHLASVEEVRWLEAAESADLDGIKPTRGALPFVAALPADRWAVVTSAPRSMAGVRLSRAGIHVPSALVCSDDVQKGKPDPEPYLRAAGLLGVAPEKCLVFEDAPAGIESARSAGMEVVALTTTFRPERLGAPHLSNGFCGSIGRPGCSGRRSFTHIVALADRPFGESPNKGNFPSFSLWFIIAHAILRGSLMERNELNGVIRWFGARSS